MATLKSFEHQLSIVPVRYQFPDLRDHWDGNWLIIALAATAPSRSWTTEEPAYTTFEVRALSAWMARAAQGVLQQGSFEATEPCLAFEVRERDLVVHFRLEFDPEGRFDGIDWQLPIDNTNVAEFAAELARESEHFPERT